MTDNEEVLSLLSDAPAAGLRAIALLIRETAERATSGRWESVAEHFAAWSPSTALAVACWLLDEYQQCEVDLLDNYDPKPNEYAVRVARAWLTGEWP